MVAIITKNSYYLNDDKPDLYVDDKTFISIIKSRKVQLALLDKLQTSTVRLGRLGRDTGDFFIKSENDLDINLTVDNIEKEYGYYAEI